MKKKTITLYVIVLIVLVIYFLFGQGRFKFGFIKENALEEKALSLSDEDSVVLERFDYHEMFNQFSVVIIKESEGNHNFFNFTRNYFFPLFSLEQQYHDIDLEEIKAFGVTTTTREMVYELTLDEPAGDISFNVHEHQQENTDYKWIAWNLLMLLASVFGIIQYFRQNKKQT